MLLRAMPIISASASATASSRCKSRGNSRLSSKISPAPGIERRQSIVLRQHRFDIRGVKRLFQKSRVFIAHALVNSLIRRRGHDNDGYAPPFPLERREGLKTAKAGHVVVQKNDVELG